MPDGKVRGLQPKKEVQQRVENSAGVFGRGEVRGLTHDDAEPQDRRDPGLQQMLLGRVQARLSRPLLHRIIRRLASDHHIVHVALAQAGPADAHKSRLLQQVPEWWRSRSNPCRTSSLRPSGARSWRRSRGRERVLQCLREPVSPGDWRRPDHPTWRSTRLHRCSGNSARSNPRPWRPANPCRDRI